MKRSRATSSPCATYMGHADIANTYWYLEATPELMTGIAAAAEALIAGEDNMTPYRSADHQLPARTHADRAGLQPSHVRDLRPCLSALVHFCQ